jgi:23S rRNA pseudouridine1911/1915/1917 synthase
VTENIKIVYKNRNLVIIDKPAGIPSQSDPTGDKDAMTLTSEALASFGEPSQLWLVHRLDRTVGGLICFARNKKSAAELSKIASDGSMKKNYIAVCHGHAEGGEYCDLLFKDSITSKAYVVKTERKGAKEAKLIAKPMEEKDGMTLVSVKLLTGRFHQIRAQMSARGNSLVGDKKYGSRDSATRYPSLFANALSFELFGKKISVAALPDASVYPWSVFDYFSKKETGERVDEDA